LSVPNNELALVDRVIDLARQGGRVERDKLGRCRSTKLTMAPSSDARPLQFITVIVKLCLQHDSVVRVHQRQLIRALCRSGGAVLRDVGQDHHVVPGHARAEAAHLLRRGDSARPRQGLLRQRATHR